MDENTKNPTNHRFELGLVLVGSGARQEIHPDDLREAIQRHARGDWGDCNVDKRAQNDLSLERGLPLVSTYHDRNGTEFNVITEADRSWTVVKVTDECWF